MNLKKLLSSSDTSYTLKYCPFSTSNDDIYGDSIELYKDNGKCHLLSSRNNFHTLLHFFGLDTTNCKNDGQEAAQDLVIFLCSDYDNDELITKYIELCEKQPFLLIYLRGIHKQLLDEPTAFMEDLNELINNFDCIKNYIISIFIKPYIKNNVFPPRTLMLLNEHYNIKNNTESIYLKLFYSYQTYMLASNTSSMDELLDITTSHLERTSKTLGTSERVSWNILYDMMNSCDCRFYVALIEFMQYMFDDEYMVKFCPNCGQYFISKYSHKTVYCLRNYAGTKSNCQEYASHTQYRKRKKENPIHSTYVTCYNKLYSRVRKGKLEKNSPLFQTLSDYRDEYTAKYEQNPSEALVKEFKEITKKL